MSVEDVLKNWQDKFEFQTNQEVAQFTNEVINALEGEEMYRFIIKVERPKYFSPQTNDPEDEKEFFEFYKARVKVVFDILKITPFNDKFPWYIAKLNKKQALRLKEENFVEALIAEYRII